jgi:predicted nucleotidyltransferase
VLDKVCNQAKSVFGESLVAVKLYGSYARGDYDDESDIDIMVIVNKDSAELSQYEKSFCDFAFDLALEYSTLPSVFLQDKTTYERYKGTYPFFQNIEREGVDLVA